MDDEAKERVRQMVKEDNWKSLLLSRLVMTRKLAGTGKNMLRVLNNIDPDFQRFDPGVLERAAKIRNLLEDVLRDTRE